MTDISLHRAAVLIDRDEASFVHHAVGELRGQIEAEAQRSLRLCYEESQIPREAEVVIAVGRLAARDAKHEPGELVVRAAEGFGGRRVIELFGGSAEGTNYAVLWLQQALITAKTPLSLPADLSHRERPRFRTRGLYLHQHWRYRHPYATWAWSVTDWCRAIDILAHLRFNLLLIWPHMDMIAPPLSTAERDHLADIRAVIDYAQRKRGLRVWLVEPANVLLDQPDVRRLPMEARDYYAYAHMDGGGLKNPADPAARAALRANREELYRHVPNADGYGYIDSDPGGWIGSPAEAFVDLLAMNRPLIDQHHERPKDVTLFHWALAGWGRGTAQEAWRDSMTGVVERVPEPRGFLAMYTHHLEILRELGQLPETLLFPYGIIEGEPTFPLTGMYLDQIEAAFDYVDRYPELGGVIGNVQTFLVQLPAVFGMARLAWDRHAIRDMPTMYRSLAELVLPSHASYLGDVWWALLHSRGAKSSWALADQVAHLSESADLKWGVIGRHVFPDPAIILRNLATMLRIHAAAETVSETADAGAPLDASVKHYLSEMLDWQRTNGFFGTYGINKKVIYDTFMYNADFRTVKDAMERRLPREARDALQARLIAEFTAAGHDPTIVDSMVNQLFGTRTSALGEIEAELFKRFPPVAEMMPWTQGRKAD